MKSYLLLLILLSPLYHLFCQFFFLFLYIHAIIINNIIHCTKHDTRILIMTDRYVYHFHVEYSATTDHGNVNDAPIGNPTNENNNTASHTEFIIGDINNTNAYIIKHIAHVNFKPNIFAIKLKHAHTADIKQNAKLPYDTSFSYNLYESLDSLASASLPNISSPIFFFFYCARISEDTRDKQNTVQKYG